MEGKIKMIKIISAYSGGGGSTHALIYLTNALNSAGYDTTYYGPSDWHLNKCKADKLNNFVSLPTDVVISHSLRFNHRLNVKKQY